MSDESDMVDRISAILGSKAALAIDFHLDQTRVFGPTIYSVVHYLNAGLRGNHGITIKFGPLDGEAAYKPRENVLRILRASYGQTDNERMTIFHECVHAWLDIRMPRIRTDSDAVTAVLLTTTHLSDEAAAYVAGALFFIYEKTFAGLKPARSDKWN